MKRQLKEQESGFGIQESEEQVSGAGCQVARESSGG